MQISTLDTKIPAPDLRAADTDPLIHLVQQGALRSTVFRSLVSRLQAKGARLVELGAGPCIFGRLARDAGYQVTAVDARVERKPSDDELGSIRFIQADIREFDLSGYDIIVCMGLLYHFDLDDQLALLEDCARTGVPVILETQVHADELVPVTIKDKWARTIINRGRYDGIIFPEQDNPMASVGNRESFWATEPSLLRMFDDAGFNDVTIVEPIYQSNYGGRRFYLLNAQGLANMENTTVGDDRLRFSILVTRGQFDEARALLANIPSAPIGPQDWGYAISVAQLRLHFGERDKAVETAIKIRDRAKDFGEQSCNALLRCASFLEAAGDTAEAEKTRTMALERLKNPVLAKSLLQQAVASGRQDTARAIAGHIETHFAADPELVKSAARVSHNTGDLGAAERMCREALLSEPNNVELLTRLGFILSRQEKREEAADLLAKAIEIDPKNERVLEKLTNISLRLKRPEDALKYARRFAHVAPDNARAHFAFASALRQNKRLGKALEHIQRAVELDPSNEKYAQLLATLSKRKAKSVEKQDG
ncbi:MAG: tetratricopeptide repeat protein [Rhizomicrobium sp.]|jgi:tetratricopeptide (TPR) repeat protein